VSCATAVAEAKPKAIATALAVRENRRDVLIFLNFLGCGLKKILKGNTA
jgi:hypothetical protein